MSVALETDAGTAELEETVAERAVIGALLLSGRPQQEEILATVDDREFGDPQCAWIVAVIREMVEAGHPVDQVTVAAHVLRTGRLAKFEQRRSLGTVMHQLAMDAPNAANALWYCRAVIEGHARREVRDLGARLQSAGPDASLEELHTVVLAGYARALNALARANSH